MSNDSKVAILLPFTSRSSFLSMHVRKGTVDVNAWMQRLITVVQTTNDQGAKDDLLHLSVFIGRTLHEAQDLQRKKTHFPAPEHQWPIIASLALENKQLFDYVLPTSVKLPPSLFTHIGAAMMIFDLSVDHEG